MIDFFKREKMILDNVYDPEIMLLVGYEWL